MSYSSGITGGGTLSRVIDDRAPAFLQIVRKLRHLRGKRARIADTERGALTRDLGADALAGVRAMPRDTSGSASVHRGHFEEFYVLLRNYCAIVNV
jgi:hypothetical protein